MQITRKEVREDVKWLPKTNKRPEVKTYNVECFLNFIKQKTDVNSKYIVKAITSKLKEIRMKNK